MISTTRWDLVRRGMAGLVLLVTQGACMTNPKPVAEPTPFLRAERPKKIWVSLANGEQLVIEGPKVYGDSLLGFTEKNGQTEEVWLPLTDLQEVKTRHLSGSRTALLGAGIAAAAGLVIISIPTSGGDRGSRCMNEGVPCEDA
jgi:hypothetical protein